MTSIDDRLFKLYDVILKRNKHKTTVLTTGIETGAILAAHKLNTKVTHTVCVVRADENAELTVLPPCGICQERLFYWGENVKAAVTNPDGKLNYKTLKEIQPHHWYKAYEG